METDYAHRLVLMRHAKSGYPDGVADHDRPLSGRGRRDAPAVGRWLGESGYAPDAVVCSTALRARGTWELAAEGLASASAPEGGAAESPAGGPKTRFEPRVYEATVLGLLMLVRELEEEHSTVMIVGHNPGMAELVVGLTDPPPAPPAGFPTASVAVLGLRGSWASAAPSGARLLDFASPADLRDDAG